MNYNILGRTNLKVSEIGLGTEYLFNQKSEVVESVIKEAIEQGVNYLDVLFSVEHFLKKIALGFEHKRDDIIIAGHLGTSELNEKPKRIRNVKESKVAFLNLLKNLQISHVDIINIQNVKANEYDQIFKPNGLVDLATSFQKECKANFIGLSTHDVSVAKRAIESVKFDMIMFPYNLVNHNLPGREDIQKLCKKNNVGLIAIKPFATGKLLQANRTVNIAKYHTGGISVKAKNRSDISPSLCLNYVKKQSSISVILMGVKSVEELKNNLSYSQISTHEIDYTPFIDTYHK
jgi:predicted aldo/keto reductase-like oxidoreductase